MSSITLPLGKPATALIARQAAARAIVRRVSKGRMCVVLPHARAALMCLQQPSSDRIILVLISVISHGIPSDLGANVTGKFRSNSTGKVKMASNEFDPNLSVKFVPNSPQIARAPRGVSFSIPRAYHIHGLPS